MNEYRFHDRRRAGSSPVARRSPPAVSRGDSYGVLSRPTRRHPFAVRWKYTSTGWIHAAGAGATAETWMRTNAPTGEGRAPGAASSPDTAVVTGPSEGPGPVELSNADQLAL